jgi:hypothetical protein
MSEEQTKQQGAQEGDGGILVVLPNGSEVPVDNLPSDTPAEDILRMLRSVSNNPALSLAQVDADESDADGVRKITLKTNAGRKGRQPGAAGGAGRAAR